VVIAAASAAGGRGAGALTSVLAALSFNFFHTEPYYTLRIADRENVIAMVLLLIVGLIVGELSALQSRSHREANLAVAGARRLEQVAAMVAGERDLDSIWPVVRDALIGQLRLAACRFEPAPLPANPDLPRILRDGRLPATEHLFTDDGFELPPGGVEVLVESGPSLLGRLVLVPTPGAGANRAERRVVVALADQLAVVAARSPKLRPLA